MADYSHVAAGLTQRSLTECETRTGDVFLRACLEVSVTGDVSLILRDGSGDVVNDRELSMSRFGLAPDTSLTALREALAENTPLSLALDQLRQAEPGSRDERLAAFKVRSALFLVPTHDGPTLTLREFLLWGARDEREALRIWGLTETSPPEAVCDAVIEAIEKLRSSGVHVISDDHNDIYAELRRMQDKQSIAIPPVRYNYAVAMQA